MSEFEKHLPGKHDQKTHGRRRGGRLLNDLKSKGGFTYHPVTGDIPKEGYAVSIYPQYEKVISSSEISQKAINDYLREHRQVFADDPRAYIGGWHDVEAGKVYLDISVVVNDTKTAEELCRQHGQEGYFDFKSGKTVIVKPPEERRKSAEGSNDLVSFLRYSGANDGRGIRRGGASDVRGPHGQASGVDPPVPNSDITKITSSQANRPAAFVLGCGGGDRVPNRLTDIQVEEISGVDKAANRKRFLLMKREGGDEGQMDKADKPMKTEDGKQYPAEAYLYVPDPEKPSTWKLRIWEDPEKKVTAAQVGRAIAALSPGGFRGNQVDIPEDEIPKIKAKLRRLWREVNPDKDPDEMPDTIKKQSFLSRIAEGLRSMFKVDNQSFTEAMVANQVNDKLWLAYDALRVAITNVLADEDMTAEEKSAKIAESLGQFQEFVLGLVAASGDVGKVDAQWGNYLVPHDGVQKVGAKIARHRLEKIKAAYAVLGEILAEVEPDEEADEVNKEEVVKVVEETVAGKVAEVAKRIDPLAELPNKLEELAKKQDELLKRIEMLENAKGVRKSIAGQDDGGKEVKKSMWAGIL